MQYCCPLEQREDFELKVLVDYDTAPSLTMGQEKIEDILVLHLEGGKDFFVSLLLLCVYGGFNGVHPVIQ